MTLEPPEGPVPELSTTRVAGGTSARVVAVAAAGLLIAVAGFAVANRPPAPAPVAVAPTAAPTSVACVGPQAAAPRGSNDVASCPG